MEQIQAAPTQYERDWAMYAHLSGLLALTHIPFANIIGPLIVYLKVRNESEYAATHARNALNFQITFGIFLFLMIVGGIFWWVGAFATMYATMPGNHDSDVGPPLMLVGGFFIFLLVLLAAAVTNLVCCILGGIAASSGRRFHYPIAIPFVK